MRDPLLKKSGRISGRNLSSLRFLHIPKTAGTTFQNILFRQYRSRKRFSFTGDADADIERFENLSEDDRRTIKLFVGHAPIVTGIKEADGAPTITFLREPISRVVSFCRHVAEGKSPYLAPTSQRFDLDKFLDSGNDELNNLQTQMLIGDWRSASPFSIREISTAEARRLALHNLKHRICYFGLQESFDESLLIFKNALGWSLPLYRSKNRGARGRTLQFREHHLQRIAELNSIDLEIYREARELFARAARNLDVSGKTLRRFRFIQTLFSATEPGERAWNFIQKKTRAAIGSLRTSLL